MRLGATLPERRSTIASACTTNRRPRGPFASGFSGSGFTRRPGRSSGTRGLGRRCGKVAGPLPPSSSRKGWPTRGAAPDASFASSSGLRAAAVGDLHPAAQRHRACAPPGWCAGKPAAGAPSRGIVTSAHVLRAGLKYGPSTRKRAS